MRLWCEEFNVSTFVETSAKTSKNVREAFELAVHQWQQLERTTERELRAQGDTIDLTRGIQLHADERSSCCSGIGTGSSSSSSANNSNTNSPRTVNRHERFN